MDGVSTPISLVPALGDADGERLADTLGETDTEADAEGEMLAETLGDTEADIDRDTD